MDDTQTPNTGDVARQAPVSSLEATMSKGALAVLVEDVFGAFQRHGVADDFDRPSDAIDALVEKARADGAAAVQADVESYKRMFTTAVSELAQISAAVGTPDDEALNYNGPENILARIRDLQAGTGLFSPAVLAELPGVTRDLVFHVAVALADKLLAAHRKGWRRWERNDWLDECREQLLQHIAKGDPLDVIVFAAFLWHHGESTRPGHDAEIQTQRARFAIDGALALGAQNESPPPAGHWLTRYWDLARSVARLDFERDDAVSRLRDLLGQNNAPVLRDAEEVKRIPTPDEARKSWGVAVYAGGIDLCTLSHDGGMSSLVDLAGYADIVRSAARALRVFIGPAEAPDVPWPECSGDPACCPENEGYGCCKPNPEASNVVKPAPESSATDAKGDQT